jgi:hypothetical protein
MSFDTLITRFAKQAPIATMVRGLMANVLSPAELNAIFRQTAKRQHESSLLFSTVVDLLGLVVSKAQRSLHAAYQARRRELSVSLAALYEKTARVEPSVTRELVRRTGQRMREVVAALEPDQVPLLAGYEVRIVDGSHLASTEHRIEETRTLRGGPLPGQALVILDPQRGLIVDMIPCEDGHAQERSLFVELVEPFGPGQLWIADRNFCTTLVESVQQHHIAWRGALLSPVAGGEAAASRVELLSLGFVPSLLDAVGADGLRVLLLPDVGQQAVVVRRAREQLVQHVLDVDPHIEVMPPRAAHQSHHLRASLTPGHAAHEQPGLSVMRSSA